MRSFTFLLLALITLPAHAAPCPTPAENLLHLHTELMVIALTCHQSSTGEDLIAAYTTFTNKNIAPLHAAESTIIGRDKTPAHLDKLRTSMANVLAQQAATQSAPIFCAANRDKPVTFAAISPEQVRAEANFPQNSCSPHPITQNMQIAP